MNNNQEPDYIIAIGPSPTSFEELNSFFEHIPYDDVSYVIVQHLSPNFKNRIVELLSKKSHLLVKEAIQGMVVCTNIVCLIASYLKNNDELFVSKKATSKIMVTIKDVTEKMKERKKIEDAEERARLAIEIAGIASWNLDLQTHQMTHSESLATTFGHHKSVKMSHSQMLSQMDPYDLKNIANKAFQEAMTTGSYKYEARINKKTGEIAWIKSHGKIFMDDNGKPLKEIGTIIDITGERKRNEALVESEQKFRMLADSMSQLVWTADPMGNINYYNLSVYKFTGLTDQQLIEGGWLQIVHPDDREENVKAWANCVQTGNDLLLEHRFLNAEGEYRWQLSHACAQKDSAGNVKMWVGTSTDIQNQKAFTHELEKQVKERTAELIDKNDALVKMNIQLQSFAYVTSHDLQEPLRKIQMFISRLYDTEKNVLSEKAKEYFERINVAASRMQILIQDLLNYSKTNTSDKIFVNTNLEDLVKGVINDYKEIIEETKAVIELYGLCDAKIIPFQMRQLFSNLIGNSLKFAHPDIAPHIVIKSKKIKAEEIKVENLNPKKMYCHICITDNGIGFEAQYETRIFEIFQRLHDNSRFSGTGIGLAIVKKIVENHNGIITAKGEPMKGATFNIYIPS